MGARLRKTAATVLCAAMLSAHSGQATESPDRAAERAPIEGTGPGAPPQSDDQSSPNDAKQGDARQGPRNRAAKITSKKAAASDATEGVYIEALAEGGYKVTWPGGCVAGFDKQGRPSYYSEPCDEPRAAESQLIVDSYRR